MRLICTSGIVGSGSQGCPAAGTVLSEECGLVTLYDAAGTPHTGNYAKIQTIANGFCGVTQNTLPPVEGECGYPPPQWAVSYSPSYVYVQNSIYWNHPENPLYGQLAADINTSFLVSYSIVYYDGNTVGWSRMNGELIGYIQGNDGWYLKFYYDQNYWPYYTYTEDTFAP